MSGIIGHLTYAMLAEKLAREQGLPVAELIGRHFDSYLAGSYLGSDIQCLPEAICVDTGREVGFGTVPLEQSPITGGAVRPWRLEFDGAAYTAREIYEQFYGRAHLLFGWNANEKEFLVPWDHLPDYFADVVADFLALYGPGARQLAYTFGWMVHVLSDSLIKSVQPGIDLVMLDGKYTSRNRPIQDLFCYHEVGVKRLGVNWDDLLADVARTPVEPIQFHYMRCGKPSGKLSVDFPDGWSVEKRPLLERVLQENRRYFSFHASDVLKEMRLTGSPQHPRCSPALTAQTGGLSYAQMMEVARDCRYTQALYQMTTRIVDVFDLVIRHLPQLPDHSGKTVTWSELVSSWE